MNLLLEKCVANVEGKSAWKEVDGTDGKIVVFVDSRFLDSPAIWPNDAKPLMASLRDEPSPAKTFSSFIGILKQRKALSEVSHEQTRVLLFGIDR